MRRFLAIATLVAVTQTSPAAPAAAAAKKTHPHREWYTVIGVVAGAAAGTGIGLMTSDGQANPDQQEVSVMWGFLLGSLIGGTIGYIETPAKIEKSAQKAIDDARASLALAAQREQPITPWCGR